jgi:hypothetical protein
MKTMRVVIMRVCILCCIGYALNVSIVFAGTNDGLWLGQTSQEQDIYLLIKDHSVQWLKTAYQLPQECMFSNRKSLLITHRFKPDNPLPLIEERNFAGEVKGSWESFTEETVLLKGEIQSKERMQGEIQVIVTKASSSNCKYSDNITWIVHKADLAELHTAQLSIGEREEAGEKDPKLSIIDGVWIGTNIEGKKVMLFNSTCDL